MKRFEEFNESYAGENTSYEVLMRKFYCIDSAKFLSYTEAVIDFTYSKHITAYNYPGKKIVNLPLGDVFGVVKHKPEIETISKIAKFLEQY